MEFQPIEWDKPLSRILIDIKLLCRDCHIDEHRESGVWRPCSYRALFRFRQAARISCRTARSRISRMSTGTPKIGDVRVIERNGKWDVERFGDPADAADPNDPPE
jgi:hypothetical protein